MKFALTELTDSIPKCIHTSKSSPKK